MNGFKNTVLVVEDDVLLRLVAVDLLEDAGYAVIEATSADEAAETFATHSEIDLVFTDVNMPGKLDGFGLARLVASVRPEVGIVIASGLTRPQPGQLPLGAQFMTKPYNPDRLLEALGEMAGGQESLSQPAPRSARG